MEQAALAALAAVLLLGLSGSGCARRTGALAIAGTTSQQAIEEMLVTAFLRRHPEIRVTVHAVDSTAAIQALRSGVAQIAVADCVSLPADAGGLTVRQIATDGIAVIVNPANTVTNVTLEQLRALFGGSARSWSEVGGPEQAVNLVLREAGSGTRQALEEILKLKQPGDSSVIQDTSLTVLDTVAHDAAALGYLSRSAVDERVRALRIEGHACTPAEIEAGTYPLLRPVRLLTQGAPEGPAREFLAFVAEEGPALLAGRGLVPTAAQ